MRTGGVGESELERLVSMSSGPELLVRNSSLSLSTSGQGELRGSDDGEDDGKEEDEDREARWESKILNEMCWGTWQMS